MKKSELSVVSSEEEDDAVLSLDGSLLTSDTDQDINFLLDSELSGGDMQTSSNLFPPSIPPIRDPDDDIFALTSVPLPNELELRPTTASSHPAEVTIWSRVELIKGKRFGPIPAQLKEGVPPSSLVWKVVDEHGTVKAWVDTLVSRGGHWTAFLRKTNPLETKNVRPVFHGGQIYLEVIRDVGPDQELHLSTCDILLPHDNPSRNGSLSQQPSSRIEGDEECSFHDVQSSTLRSSSPSGSSIKSQGLPPPLVPIPGHEGQSPIKDGPIRCLACDLEFTDHYRLNEHIGNCHFSEDSGQGEREYKCSQCPKVFNWKSNLIRHQVAHDESRRYVCENCKKVFTDPSNLQRHIRSQHIGARSHACPECGKTFATSSGLKQHTHIHSSVKPFRCEVCFKAYTQFSNLCRHKRMHANCRMQIKCNKCGQAFSAVTSLSKHKRFCEGTPNTSASSASNQAPNFQIVSSSASAAVSHDNSERTAPMSLTSPTNPLLFYPRPGFPLYPPPLFSYPLFSGASLPAPPPLIPDGSLLAGNGASVVAAAAAQDLQRHLLNYGNATSNLNTRVSSSASKPEVNAPIKHEKRNSEASESEASEELTSDTGGEELSSFSDAESDADTIKSIGDSSQFRDRTTPSLSSGLTTMFSNQRQGSPKQGAVCPDPSVLMSPSMVSLNGLARPMVSNSIKSDHDMPFDLSRHSKSRHLSGDSPTFHSKTRDESKVDEPLDLRVPQKKSFPVMDDVHPKTHLVVEKERERDFPDPPPLPPVVPEPIRHIEPPKLESPPPPPSPTKLTMAYPRPIHPMFLESMYRLQQEKPTFNIYPGHERLMAPFPPRYPFLGPLLGASPSFDFIRAAHMEKMGKPMHEIMSPHLNKSKERYSCKFCGKIFPRSANLTRHLRTHTGEQPYKCKYCERSFSISSNLQRHVRNIHNKEKPFKCPLCDRCFGQQTNLDRHLKKHEADGPTILDDSPKGAEVEDKDEAYFDEIRNFIGKVTNSGGTNCPANPMDAYMGGGGALDDSQKKRERDSDMSSPRQTSDNDDIDELPSENDEEPATKKYRTEVHRLKSANSPGTECKSPDSTRDLAQNDTDGKSHPPLTNGEAKLSHQKALAYEMMLSINGNLDLTNGVQENGRPAVDDEDAEDEEDDEEGDDHKEYSEDEMDTCERNVPVLPQESAVEVD